tara:strand:+ start:215 stop:556 length:342 start_codon:yes stop_codon:yes gene_type:complete
MEIKGKLIKMLQAEAGTTKAGKAWESQTCLIDTEEKYNNIVAVRAMGERVKQMNKLKEGDMVTISVNVYSREYNGKYYNQIDGWWFVNQNEVKKDSGFTPTDFVTSDDKDLPF